MKRYPLNQSPLYNLKSKRKLCAMMGVSLNGVKKLLEPDRKNYKVWEIEKGGKKRKITEPKSVIKSMQKSIQILLSKIETPEYLFSGKRDLYYVDNARHHVKANHILNIDISKFYPNSKREYVFRALRYSFKMSEDVAWLLSDILIFDDMIPTGSPHSQLLAYFAYQDMFEEINNLAKDNELEFSLFVDDMTFSSAKQIPKHMVYFCRKILMKSEHTTNKSKTKWYYQRDFKIVTGVAISPKNILVVRNKLRKEIVEKIKEFRMGSIKSEKEITSLIGKIQAARQVEPKIFTAARLELLEFRKSIKTRHAN